MAVASCGIRIFSKGAEGYNSLEPWGEHDVLENSFWNYTAELTTHPLFLYDWRSCELIREVGCVRPALMQNPQAQSLANWSFTGGDWAVEQWIGYPVNVLKQNDTTANTEWSAETVRNFPENPRFEMVINAYTEAADQDWTTYVSYLTLTVADSYRIWMTSTGNALFQRYYNGEWYTMDQFHFSIVNEIGVLWWDPLAGGLSISTDLGFTRHTWLCTPDVDVTNVTIPEGKLKITGNGVGLSAFAINELHAVDSGFTSTYRGTYEERGGSYTIDVATWGRFEPGSGMAGTDLSIPAPPANVQYSVDLNQKTLNSGSDENHSFIPIHRLPELYAVDIEQAATQVAALSFIDPDNYTSFADIRAITIDHPPEGGWTAPQTCRIEIPWSPHASLTGNYRFRFCIVRMNDYRGSSLSNVFYGIIVNFSFTEGKDGCVLILDLVNSTFFRAQKVRQERHWPVLGGLTDLAARNQWVKLIGLPTSRGVWTTTGTILPKGDPRDPWGAPWEGNEAQELLDRIDWATGCLSYHDAKTGYIQNILRSAYSTVGSVTTFYKGKSAAITGSSDPWLCWDDVSVVEEGAQELITRWKAVGSTPSGDYVSARATDWAAERQTSAGNFVGFPALQIVEGQYPGQSLANIAALAAYDSSNKAWRRVQFRSPGLITASPPMWVYINGSDRLGDTDAVRILGVRHEFTLGELWTYYEGVSMVL